MYTDRRRGGLDQLHRRGRRIAPPVVLRVVQLVAVGRGGRGVVKRDQHIAALNVDPDHVGALVQRGELHRRTRNRQALICNRRAKRTRRAGVYVVDIHHGRGGLEGSGSDVSLELGRKHVAHLALLILDRIGQLGLRKPKHSRSLVLLSIRKQPIGERPVDAVLQERGVERDQGPTGWRRAWALPSRGGDYALVVVAVARGIREVDLVVDHIRRGSRVGGADVAEGVLPIEDEDRIAGQDPVDAALVDTVHVGRPRPVDHLHPSRGQQVALLARVERSGRRRLIYLEQRVDGLLARLLPWQQEIALRHVARLLHHRAPDVRSLGHVARVADRAAVGRQVQRVGAGRGRIGRRGETDLAEIETVRLQYYGRPSDIGRSAHRAGSHIEERAVSGCAIVYRQLDLVTPIGPGIETSNVGLRSKKRRDVLDHPMLRVGHGFH